MSGEIDTTAIRFLATAAEGAKYRCRAYDAADLHAISHAIGAMGSMADEIDRLRVEEAHLRKTAQGWFEKFRLAEVAVKEMRAALAAIAARDEESPNDYLDLIRVQGIARAALRGNP